MLADLAATVIGEQNGIFNEALQTIIPLSEEMLEGVLNEVTKAFTTAISLALCQVRPRCACLDAAVNFQAEE